MTHCAISNQSAHLESNRFAKVGSLEFAEISSVVHVVQELTDGIDVIGHVTSASGWVVRGKEFENGGGVTG